MQLIPIERVVNISAGQKADDIKKKYIESFCDPLTNEQISKQLDTKYEEFEKRLSSIKNKQVV